MTSGSRLGRASSRSARAREQSENDRTMNRVEHQDSPAMWTERMKYEREESRPKGNVTVDDSSNEQRIAMGETNRERPGTSVPERSR